MLGRRRPGRGQRRRQQAAARAAALVARRGHHLAHADEAVVRHEPDGADRLVAVPGQPRLGDAFRRGRPDGGGDEGAVDAVRLRGQGEGGVDLRRGRGGRDAEGVRRGGRWRAVAAHQRLRHARRLEPRREQHVPHARPERGGGEDDRGQVRAQRRDELGGPVGGRARVEAAQVQLGARGVGEGGEPARAAVHAVRSSGAGDQRRERRVRVPGRDGRVRHATRSVAQGRRRRRARRLLFRDAPRHAQRSHRACTAGRCTLVLSRRHGAGGRRRRSEQCSRTQSAPPGSAAAGSPS